MCRHRVFSEIHIIFHISKQLNIHRLNMWNGMRQLWINATSKMPMIHVAGTHLIGIEEQSRITCSIRGRHGFQSTDYSYPHTRTHTHYPSYIWAIANRFAVGLWGMGCLGSHIVISAIFGAYIAISIFDLNTQTKWIKSNHLSCTKRLWMRA